MTIETVESLLNIYHLTEAIPFPSMLDKLLEVPETSQAPKKKKPAQTLHETRLQHGPQYRRFYVYTCNVSRIDHAFAPLETAGRCLSFILFPRYM